MSSEVRLGNVSSIDYENGLCEVTYPDRDDTVTEMVPMLSNREYRMPEVDDLVVVLHPGDSPEDAVILGTIWNEKIKPVEGKEKVFRKEYSNEDGKAYRKFDANAKELLDFVDGKKILKAKSLEIKIGSATVTISESGSVKVDSPAGIEIKASGELKLSATTLTASAATVNITGGGGDVTVSGKSLVKHTHNGNLGKPTTQPL
nr:MAG TPA: baseplate protein [Caudoviricetes sp.]